MNKKLIIFFILNIFLLASCTTTPLVQITTATQEQKTIIHQNNENNNLEQTIKNENLDNSIYNQIPENAIPIITTHFGEGGGDIVADTPCDKTRNYPYFESGSDYQKITNPADSSYYIMCGWIPGEKLTVEIQNPNGQISFDEIITSDKTNYYFDRENYMLFGNYNISFISNNKKLSTTIFYEEPKYPITFINSNKNQIIIKNFKPNESILVYIYEPQKDQFDNTSIIMGTKQFYVDQNGELIINLNLSIKPRQLFLIKGEYSGTFDPQHEVYPYGPIFDIDSNYLNLYTKNNCEFSSQYIADVTIPDGTIMKPGEKFTKTWTIKNNGTCTWQINDNIIFDFIKGDNLSGDTEIQIPTNLYPIKPGDIINVSVNLYAPIDQGKYRSYWQFKTYLYQTYVSFGQTPYVEIVVK